MASISRFEEIEAWKAARVLTNQVYDLSNLGTFAKDYGLRDQMRRASVSILSNIAEGFERGGNKEFLHFLSIAKGSVGELRAQLYIALDRQYFSSSQFDQLHGQAVRISRMISGLMNYLQRTDFRGPRYRSPHTNS
jgi:four helix bundle protein